MCIEHIHLSPPIVDKVEPNFEIISKTFSVNQNSAHGIYD